MWEAYKLKGNLGVLVSTTQGQALKSAKLSKVQLKDLIIELEAVLKCSREESRQEVESVKPPECAKRPWSVRDLAGLAGEMEALDSTKKRRLREDIQKAHRWLFAGTRL